MFIKSSDEVDGRLPTQVQRRHTTLDQQPITSQREATRQTLVWPSLAQEESLSEEEEVKG